MNDTILLIMKFFLQTDGSVFVTTINRTMVSWLGVILAWEHILKRLPVGTHSWDQFRTPEEIISTLFASRLCVDCWITGLIKKSCTIIIFVFPTDGCITKLVHGMGYNPVTNSWHWINSTDVNFAIHAVKKNERDIHKY